MAAAVLLRSLGSKMARAPPTLLARGRSWHGGSSTHDRLLHQRRLHHGLNSSNCGSSGSMPPNSKTDLHMARSKIRTGVAYAMLFGSMVYMCITLYPRLEAKVEAKLEARKRSKLNEAYATEALKILQAERASVNSPGAQIMQSSGHGKHTVGETGKGRTRLDYLEAEITKLDIAAEARRSK